MRKGKLPKVTELLSRRSHMFRHYLVFPLSTKQSLSYDRKLSSGCTCSSLFGYAVPLVKNWHNSSVIQPTSLWITHINVFKRLLKRSPLKSRIQETLGDSVKLSEELLIFTEVVISGPQDWATHEPTPPPHGLHVGAPRSVESPYPPTK